MSENFETFLRFWTAENIRSAGRAGPTDQTVRSLAQELKSAATTAGFYGELDEAAHPYGGVEGYVRNKIKEVKG